MMTGTAADNQIWKDIPRHFYYFFYQLQNLMLVFLSLKHHITKQIIRISHSKISEWIIHHEWTVDWWERIIQKGISFK